MTTLLQKISDALISGEFIAMATAGLIGWFVATDRKKREDDQRREAELARANFRLENAETARAAIREGIAEIKETLSPTIGAIRCDVEELRTWLSAVDRRCDVALQSAKTLEKTQTEFFKRAELTLGQILSKDGNHTLIRHLFNEVISDAKAPSEPGD
jgi:hypothetical protein